jgi:hypothetical protein
MTKEELEAFLRTLDIWVIVFGVLVAIGVTGEAVVGFLYFRKGNQLHKLEVAENLAQQGEIARLNKEKASCGDLRDRQSRLAIWSATWKARPMRVNLPRHSNQLDG